MVLFYFVIDGNGAIFFKNGDKNVGNFEHGILVEQFHCTIIGI